MADFQLADLERIVQTVGRESERLRGGRKRARVGPLQKGAFLLLRIVALSLPIALALLLIGLFFLDWSGSIQALALLLWIILVGPVLLLVLTLLNLPLLVTTWKQRRLILSRGLLVPAIPGWQRKGRWIVLALTVLAGALHLTWPAFNRFGGFVLVLLLITFPFLLVMMQSFLKLAEGNLALLREVEQLKVVLEEKLNEARREQRTHVEMNHELAVRVEEATTEILGQERLRAIAASMGASGTQYSVSQSSGFRRDLEGLEAAMRLQVLDRISDLADDHRPERARHDEDSGHWHWTPGDPEVEIVYEVADGTRQVLVRGVRLLPPGHDEAAGAG